MKTANNIRNTSIIIILILFSFIVACTYKGQTGAPGRAESPLSNEYHHYSLGVLFMLDGEIDKAIGEYEKALRIDPESAYLMSELATLYIKKGKINAAARLLEKSVTCDPEYVDSHILLGSLYGNLEEYEDAINEYKKVIEIDPEKLEAYLFLSLLYRENKDYNSAIDVLGSLLEIDPCNLMGSYYLAKAYAAVERYDETETWLQKTLDIKPAFRPALADLGLLYRSQGKDGKAVEIYMGFLRNNPADIRIRFELGKALLKLKRYDTAAEELEKILKRDSSLADVRFSLGLAYFFGGEEYDRAIGEFLAVLEAHPDDYKAMYFLASAYEKKEQYMDAVKKLEAIPEKSDLYAVDRVRMGLILKEEGHTEKAIELIRKEIEKGSKDLEFYSFLAAIYEEEDRFEDAEDILKKGLSLSPQDTDLHYRLGILYGKRNKHQQSIEEMETVLKLDPDNADAINFIGYSYADRGLRLDEAERLIKEALRLKPDNGYIMDSLGWVYFKQNRVKLAIDYLKRALDLLPEDPTIAGHLGDAYEKNGQMEKAMNVYKRALELNPENNNLKKKIRIIRIPSE
ncbi:MAG: tetratricopeptide repeat protein [Deltaproteobacteria bacterium]|nr:tetratricopeptide repeat protein [Deltaproteobacteria bacterium]